MSIQKKLAKVIQTIFRQALRISRALTNKLMNWLLRSFLVIGRRQARLSKAGFVLPTIVMVILVVMLLTTAILFRSFDRTKNISNLRVSQQSVNAALPAIDRAKAKIDALLNNQTTRGTPNDQALNDELIKDKYSLGDENRLQLTYNPPSPLESSYKTTYTNGWRFPVDTDNNGKFDSFTLYSLLFSTPPRATDGSDQRQRTPLEARTIPMQQSGQANPNCPQAAGTSASLTGYQGWYKSGSQLKRSFFVYVATVPITKKDQPGLIPSSGASNYEKYQGNKGFSALEFQQDTGKVSVANNAILYEDDLDISPGGGLTVNGRIQTNSNLFVTKTNENVNLRQVSSNQSCYYEALNAKIIVGGNLAYGSITGTSTGGDINIDLFEGTKDANDPQQDQPLKAGETSLKDSPPEIAYNTQAYEARINKLVQLALTNDPSGATDPTEVKDGITSAKANDPTIQTPAQVSQVRQDQLDIYFRERTRRVPFKEVPSGGTDSLLASITTSGSGESLQPAPSQIMYPFAPSGGASNTGLTLNTAGNKLLPSATQFSKQENDTTGKEPFLGDRILVGNNLPQNWIDPNNNNTWATSDTEQPINGTNWDDPTDQTRSRKTRVTLLSDVADARRNGFWEKNAQKAPVLASDGIGGLRVVTGAGVYLPPPRTPFTSASTVVWPDTMPVIPPSAGVAVGSTPPSWLPANPITGNTADFPVDATGKYRPYLHMRATAVYHYRNGKTPIACVSSFYDPTDKDTARNAINPTPALPDVSGLLFDPNQPYRLPRNAAKYNSNNGVTYPAPTASEQSVRYLLNYQAQLVYPNGRLVNPLLQEALATIAARRTLAQQAAVDSTLCSLQILGYRNVPPLTPNPTPTAGYPLPHGTIQEVAFLDGRQIKAIDGQDNPATLRAFDTQYFPPTGKYDLAVEQRQPLEIRATVLNLDNLRKAATPAAPYGKPEYMLPNSGIIYATRDDAMPDGTQASNPDYSDAQDDASAPSGKQVLKLSANDFQLDPTRRPNGIMLTNGLDLSRQKAYREEEKGLILASNLPVYLQATPVPNGLGSLKGGFNLHRNGGGLVEEFTQKVADGFYNRTTLDPNFACRSNDPRLPAGACNDPDQWRAATVIADSVTLLSHSTDPTKPFSGFKAGYRSDGDYDLRNNEIDNIANADTSTTAPELQNLDGPTIEQKRLAQGFWNNNFVTTRKFTDTAYSNGQNQIYTPSNPSPATDTVNSSYFNNAVTPVQRRGLFSVYLMEMCSKRVVSDCTATDWSLDPLGVGRGVGSGAGTKATTVIGQSFAINKYPSGTTAQSHSDSLINAIANNPELARLPRRVAFARNNTGNLILDGSRQPIPLAINTTGRIACYTYNAPYTIPSRLTGGAPASCPVYSSTNIQKDTNQQNALWFATTSSPITPYLTANVNYGYDDGPLAYLNSPRGTSSLPPLTQGPRGTTNQPLLVPVLQLQAPRISPANSLPNLRDTYQTRATNWLPRAAGDTTFNLLMAVGDSPSHPRITTPFSHDGDFNGGVQNLPRFLEDWIQRPTPSSPSFNTNISGSFIQIKRSYYATAPFTQLSEGVYQAGGGGYPKTRSIFSIYGQGYPTSNTNGKAPYYEIPTRNWGFDVGLLAQVPDLFSNQFVLAPTGKPNEFFREVDRSDDWVQTLLCAKIIDNTTVTPITATNAAVNSDQRPSQFCQSRSAP